MLATGMPVVPAVAVSAPCVTACVSSGATPAAHGPGAMADSKLVLAAAATGAAAYCLHKLMSQTAGGTRFRRLGKTDFQ